MTGGTSTQLQFCLERLRVGDEAARGALVARAQDRLHRLARRVLGDFARIRRFEDTDDVMQNATLRLMQRLKNHTPANPAEFFALAAREIRRELLDMVRHYYGPQGAGRREIPRPNDGSSSNAGALCDPSQHTHDPNQLGRWTELHEQVEKLPVEQREVFDLLWYHGLTRPEAADVLGISEPTVKRRWLAARLQLQSQLHFEAHEF